MNGREARSARKQVCLDLLRLEFKRFLDQTFYKAPEKSSLNAAFLRHNARANRDLKCRVYFDGASWCQLLSFA
jgi:hypothetical protein